MSKPTREEIQAIIKANENAESPLTKAFNDLSEGFSDLRNALRVANPGKELEIDEKLTEWLNHPDNPLKKIQAAHFKA